MKGSIDQVTAEVSGDKGEAKKGSGSTEDHDSGSDPESGSEETAGTEAG